MGKESAEALARLFSRLARELGELGAEGVIRTFAEEIGGFRMIFPDIKTLERMARDQDICRRFDGQNYGELALRYQRSPNQIRRIVNRGRGR